MKFHFRQNDRYEIHTYIEFQTHMRINRNSNESVLIHFVLGKSCSHENLISVWNFFSIKRPIWNPYCFEFHFTSIHLSTSKELTENRSEIFNWNEISYRFEFISFLMWTYSKEFVCFARCTDVTKLLCLLRYCLFTLLCFVFATLTYPATMFAPLMSYLDFL